MDKLRDHALSEAKLAEVAALYGVQIASQGSVEGGYRNISHSFTGKDGKECNFILYKNEPGITQLIQRTNALGTHIAEKGLPVRTPLDERILRVGRRYGSLYNYLDGAAIPWEAYTMKHIKLLGQALAAFHTAGVTYRGELPHIEDVCLEIQGRMQKYFSQPGVIKALREKLSLTISLPSYGRTVLPYQESNRVEKNAVLHMDFVRGNLLFRNLKEASFQENEVGVFQIGDVELAGILDLEKAARGPVEFDLARTLAFLLVDCPKPVDKIRKYFLYSGYVKRGDGSLPDINLLDSLVTFFLAYDFYKFLKQNPYESLPKNHHFKRTVGILLERKVLHYSN